MSASAAARSARYAGTLRLLTVNDIYSPGPVDGVGGWACLSTMLQQYRTPSSILCINGDFLGGSALAEHHQGRNVVALLDALRTDVVVIGNHEFDYGAQELKARIRETNKACTWLGSNVRERSAEAAASPSAAETDADGDGDGAGDHSAVGESLFENVTDLMQVQVELQRVVDDSDAQTASGAAAAASPSAAQPAFPASAPVRIGMFGVCTPHTPQLSWPGPLVSFAPVLPVVERCVAELKGHTQQAPAAPVPLLHLPRPVAPAPSSSDAATAAAVPAPAAPTSSEPFLPSDGVVAVTHLSNAEDRKIARTHGKNINVVIGGHDHDAISLMEGNTLLFKAGQNAFWLGVIDLTLELTLTEKSAAALASASPAPSTLAVPIAGAAASAAPAPSVTPPPQLMSPSLTSVAGLAAAASPFHRGVSIFPSWRMIHNRGFAPDPAIARIVAGFTAAMEAAQSAASGGEDPDEVVCTVGEPASLPEGVTELSEEAAASLLLTRTSAVRAGPASFPEMVADAMASHYSEVGCDAAIINGGFVRGDRAYGLGTAVTLRDVRYELPFPKVAVLLRIRGDAIVQALGEMLASHPTPSGSYPHCSAALHVEFDSTLPVGCKTKVKRVTLRGAPLELEREYLLSVTTFMASGGDGVAGFSRGTIVSQDQHKVSDLVLKHMRVTRVIHPNLRPRVKAITTRNNRS